jgi:hypothetical protein
MQTAPRDRGLFYWIAPNDLCKLRAATRDAPEQITNGVVSGDNNAIENQSTFDEMKIIGDLLAGCIGKTKPIDFSSKRVIAIHPNAKDLAALSSTHGDHPIGEESSSPKFCYGLTLERVTFPLAINLRREHDSVADFQDRLEELAAGGGRWVIR